MNKVVPAITSRKLDLLSKEASLFILQGGFVNCPIKGYTTPPILPRNSQDCLRWQLRTIRRRCDAWIVPWWRLLAKTSTDLQLMSEPSKLSQRLLLAPYLSWVVQSANIKKCKSSMEYSGTAYRLVCWDCMRNDDPARIPKELALVSYWGQLCGKRLSGFFPCAKVVGERNTCKSLFTRKRYQMIFRDNFLL